MTIISYETDYETKHGGCRHYHINDGEVTYLAHYVLNAAKSPLEYGTVSFNVISPLGVEVYRGSIPTRMNWSTEVNITLRDEILKHYHSTSHYVTWENTFDPKNKIITGKYIHKETGDSRNVAMCWAVDDEVTQFTAFAHGELILDEKVPSDTPNILQVMQERVNMKLFSTDGTTEISSYDGPNVHTMAQIGGFKNEEKSEDDTSNRDIIELLRNINANLEILVKNTTKTHTIQFGGNLKIGTP